MLRLDYLSTFLLLMAIVPSVTLAQEGTPQGAGTDPFSLPGTIPPTLLPNDDRFVEPLKPPQAPASSDPEVLSPAEEGFDIFDSERSRRACVEEVIPIPIERLRFEYADGTNGIYSDAELLGLAAPLIEKQTGPEGLTVADLCDFADRVTRKYVEDGYYTSRAFVPEQELRPEGTLTIRVVEGKITPQDIQITGLKHLDPEYIRDRIALGIGPNSIFRYQDIDDRLRLLQANPLIEEITAAIGYDDSLKPRPAQTRLNVDVTEKRRVSGQLSIDNYGSESIGTERMTAGLTFRNPSGIGDIFSVNWTPAIEGGSQFYRLSYRAPLNVHGGTLRLQSELNRTEIVQPPFDAFDITGRSENYLVSLRQPLLFKPNQEFALSLGYSFQRNQTFIQDQGIAFNRGPEEDGSSRMSIVHFGQDYLYRGAQSIWALQSQLNWGTGLMDATVNSSDPDSQFLSWFFQAQNIQQINPLNIFISRLDLQLANDGLLNAEQFVIGGANSVRGYRQNLRSGDNGLYFSTENRIQAYRSITGRSLIQISPFVDLGYVWDQAKNTNEPSQNNFLASLGVGFQWDPLSNLNFRMDYGYPLTQPSQDDRGQDALQSQGLHFRVNYDFD
ncbi:MAG: ShlB/FhaC/HecB family hemolysin secretion/activation protein [Prochlorotrichaceae cyanobacterium]